MTYIDLYPPTRNKTWTWPTDAYAIASKIMLTDHYQRLAPRSSVLSWFRECEMAVPPQVLPEAVAQALAEIEIEIQDEQISKGDRAGHPFRGNQWTGGRGGARLGVYDDEDSVITIGSGGPTSVMEMLAQNVNTPTMPGEIEPLHGRDEHGFARVLTTEEAEARYGRTPQEVEEWIASQSGIQLDKFGLDMGPGHVFDRWDHTDRMAVAYGIAQAVEDMQRFPNPSLFRGKPRPIGLSVENGTALGVANFHPAFNLVNDKPMTRGVRGYITIGTRGVIAYAHGDPNDPRANQAGRYSLYSMGRVTSPEIQKFTYGVMMHEFGHALHFDAEVAQGRGTKLRSTPVDYLWEARHTASTQNLPSSKVSATNRAKDTPLEYAAEAFASAWLIKDQKSVDEVQAAYGLIIKSEGCDFGPGSAVWTFAFRDRIKKGDRPGHPFRGNQWTKRGTAPLHGRGADGRLTVLGEDEARARYGNTPDEVVEYLKGIPGVTVERYVPDLQSTSPNSDLATYHGIAQAAEDMHRLDPEAKVALELIPTTMGTAYYNKNGDKITIGTTSVHKSVTDYVSDPNPEWNPAQNVAMGTVVRGAPVVPRQNVRAYAYGVYTHEFGHLQDRKTNPDPWSDKAAQSLGYLGTWAADHRTNRESEHPRHVSPRAQDNPMEMAAENFAAAWLLNDPISKGKVKERMGLVVKSTGCDFGPGSAVYEFAFGKPAISKALEALERYQIIKHLPGKHDQMTHGHGRLSPISGVGTNGIGLVERDLTWGEFTPEQQDQIMKTYVTELGVTPEQATQNLVDIYTEFDNGIPGFTDVPAIKDWYQVEYHDHALKMVEVSGGKVTLEQAVGIIAAESPGRKWAQNKDYALKTAATWGRISDTKLSDVVPAHDKNGKPGDLVKAFNAKALENQQKHASTKAAYEAEIAKYGSAQARKDHYKALGEKPPGVTPLIYPKLLTGNETLRDVLDPANGFNGYRAAGLLVAKDNRMGGQSFDGIGKGVAIAAGEPIGKYVQGPKARSFYNNGLDPGGTRDTTSDVHMFRAQVTGASTNPPTGAGNYARLDSRSSAYVDNPKFSGVTVGIYPLSDKVIRDATVQINAIRLAKGQTPLIPDQVQAIDWTAQMLRFGVGEVRTGTTAKSTEQIRKELGL